MATIMEASKQWSSRPDDERFLTLTDMQQHFQFIRDRSRAAVVSSRKLIAQPYGDDHKGLIVQYGDDVFAPTHYSFGQLSQYAEARATYLRRLPSELAADCINYGLQVLRDREEVGILAFKNGSPVLRSVNGPNYGRIWNTQILDALVNEFGDGQGNGGNNPAFRIPREYGWDGDHDTRHAVSKQSTTLYASDHDMWVFLADEENRIEVPNRRNGERGTLARGFFVWNSETADKTFGIATFLFDFMCGNHIIWGAEQYGEIRIRHTATAPERFIEEITPALISYSKASAEPINKLVENAQKAKIGDADAVTAFLATRFGGSKRIAETVMATHQLEEGRPIESFWDAQVGVTAYAKSFSATDKRVEVERVGGQILDMASK